MGVLIDNRQETLRISLKKTEKTAQAILNALGFPEGELSILIVDTPQIETLNRRYLNREGPTNVIAFPMREGDFSGINPQLLGDVVICTDVARREAELSGMSIESRFNALLVHGILHLAGYEHEGSRTEARRMARKSRQILKVLKEISC